MPTVQIENGLHVFYREQGSGEQVLLLIHGNVASSRWWEKVMAQLPAGIRAVAPDLRGCGDTDKPEGPWTMDQLADDIWQFTRALGLTQFGVVGHSLGGAVAQQLTVAHPDQVLGLVLVNSAAPDGLQTPEDKYAQLEMVVQTPQYLKMALAAMMPTAPQDGFYHQLLEDGVTKSAGAMIRNGRALGEMNVVEAVKGLKVPTLVVYGQQDPLVTLEMAERTRDLIPGARLEVLEGVGHSAPVEAPERFTQLLLEFMGQ